MIYSTISSTASMAILLISIFIYLNNKKATVNRGILLLGIGGFLWLFPYSLMYILDKKTAFLMMRIGYTSICFIPALLFHFTISFLELKMNKMLISLPYIVGTIFSFLLHFTNYIVDGLVNYSWGFYPKAGRFNLIFLLYFTMLYNSCVVFLFYYSKKKEMSERKQRQIKYIFLAFLVTAITSLDFLPSYGIGFRPIGYLSMFGWSIIAGYAIVRYRILDIEVVIRKVAIYSTLFAVTYSIIAFFAFLGQVVFENITGGNRWISLIPSILIITLALRPLENFLIGITDKFLFQKKYDYKELLKTFTGEVLTVLDLNRLTRLTVYKLSDIIKLVSCGILLLDEEQNGYKLAASYGIRERDIFLDRENTLASFMERTRAYLSIKHQGKDSPIPKKIIKDMNRLKVELAIPLILHNKMIGILTLGNKKSDEPYTQDDIDILLPLARTLSIAISNAELFDELSKTQAEAAQREKMAVIGTLSAGINHEICNPLGIVRGQCEAFLLNLKDGFYKNKSKDELLDKAIDIMRKTIKEVDRATAVTKRLSGFAKPIKEIKLDEVKIDEEINEIMALVGHELKLEKIDVVRKIPDELPNIVADRKQIQEIFFNLIRNAGQAIGEKGRIIIRAKYNGNNRILIEIEDTGHGIPEDKIDQIFNPFYTTKEPGKGTGLGLFIVRQIVEKNKGRISVKSKVGVGTTFTLEFPAAVKAEV